MPVIPMVFIFSSVVNFDFDFVILRAEEKRGRAK